MKSNPFLYFRKMREESPCVAKHEIAYHRFEEKMVQPSSIKLATRKKLRKYAAEERLKWRWPYIYPERNRIRR